MVNIFLHSFIRNKAIITITLLNCLIFPVLYGQEATGDFYYRVYFTDKGGNDANDYVLSDLVMPKAIERRKKSGITSPDYTDVPVYKRYIGRITSLGYKLHCTSKWMNTALFTSERLMNTGQIRELPFVADVRLVKNNNTKSEPADKFDGSEVEPAQSMYNRPISMINGVAVHNSGFRGKGVLVAILDGGFTNADNIPSLNSLRNRDGIKGSYDFVNNSELVYDFHYHGTAVLSVLSGEISDSLQGSAPEADFLLLRTEDPETEFPVEEDFWTAGAEYADSLGADIISSSVGYFEFDDPLMNYKYSDLDGNSTMITKAADIAASKGILIVCSAGNERDNEWIHIVAPADGDSVLAVGAVDENTVISSFSSAGPSYDRRIKPEIVAQGVGVPLQINEFAVEKMSGTSFSCPVISGMCACIIQAVPEATNYDIISALMLSSDKYLSPDSLYGHGIPDVSGAIELLQDKYISYPENSSVARHNPCKDELTITFKDNPGKLMVEIYGNTGILFIRKQYKDYISHSIKIDDFRNLEQGLYFVRIFTSSGTFTHKIIKISR